jgi:mono/diheme cytochrome c family protein
MKAMQFKTLRWFASSLAVIVLAGCSGGGAPTTENPVTQAPPVTDYVGPAAADADIQAFRINLWENIKANNRCGSCHGAGGQTPMFARNDDVNLAYQAANTVVNLTQPDQSRMVAKVGGGHNCWLQSPAACGDTLTVWIKNWAGSSASGGTTIQLQAPAIKEVGGSKSFPGSSAGYGDSDLYKLVRNAGTANCVRCHSSSSATQQQPFFADADIDVAYAAIKSKINLDNPDQSRVVVRLKDEFHNCWGSAGCAANADTMLDAVKAFAGTIDVTNVDASLLISKGLTLYDGTVAAGGNRYENATIAKYEFKTGAGNIAYDTSGHEPALNLTLSGDVTWVGGWGINIKAGGKAQGTAAASKKLTDLIKSTGEFTIEAWVNNANVAQENAYIVSYSAGVNARNATLAQNEYAYQAYTRSDKTGKNGNPILMTKDEDAQAALQHVVLTYSPVEGRRLYVNGESTGDVDAQGGGSLADWDDTFALVLGNETSTNRQWEGVLRLVAIHNRVLTAAQIQQNFDAGVGEKYFMLFSVAHLLPNISQPYVMLEAQQLDSYGIQFAKPTFISLDPNVTISDVPIKGIRIGLNGLEAHAGQAYQPLSQHITGANYKAGTGQEMTKLGTVIQLEKGVLNDLFFLSFEEIGTNRRDYPPPPKPQAPPPPTLAPEADVGLRTFDELNATLSNITGIPVTNTRVAATYDTVKQGLPSIEKFGTFGAAQQTALAQLAIQYCNQMVDTPAARIAFYGAALNPLATASATFGTSGAPNNMNRDLVIDALLQKGINTGVHTNPDDTVISAEIDNLINKLVSGPTGGAASGTGTVMKAACGAVLGSGTTLIQ